MLMPKKIKFRRHQRGRMRGKAYRGSKLSFGQFGLKALDPGWITSQQIEASRIAITRHIKRGGKVWIRIFPDKPVTENLQRQEWEKEKVLLNTGSQLSSLEEYYLKLRGFPKSSQKKLSGSRNINCLLKLLSLRHKFWSIML